MPIIVGEEVNMGRSLRKQERRTLQVCLQVLAVCLTSSLTLLTAHAATSLVVTSSSDVTADDGQTTLREAIAFARTFPANQTPTITFAASVTGTITLSGSNIDISRPFNGNLVINGPGAAVLSVSGNAQSNIFYADGVGNATISGLSFINGLATSGGAIEAVPNAEDEEISGTLSLTDCVFSGNRATYESGAIDGGCVLRLLRCSFLNNSSDQFQGAIQFFSYSQSRPSSATDCVFVGNTAQRSGGAISIFSDGATALTNCVFTNNAVTGQDRGGALQINNDFNDAVVINGCTFNDNRASGGQGGAIDVFFCPRITLNNSRFFNNSAAKGGAMSIKSTAEVVFNGSVLGQNNATDGGAIHSEAPLTLTNSTLSGNTASGLGGGIFINSTQSSTTLSAQFTTITANSAAEGGGIYLGDNRTGNLARSIVANNSAATNPDLRGAFTSGGFNVVGKLASATGFSANDRTGTVAAPLDARLGALADNGGPTLTHALLTGSPALDLATAVAGITTDQRGFPRPVGPNADAGAFEAQLPTLDLNGPAPGTGVTTAFTEQTPVVIAPAVVIVSDSNGLSSASISLNENPDNAGETLSANTSGTAITATYNAATRTLNLSGVDSVANYRQVLASVTYNNTSDTPNIANRTLVFSISTGGQSNISATATLTVTAVNDAPVAAAQSVSTNEDTPLNIVLSASDVDTPVANLTYRIVNAPQNGTLSGTAPNLIYTPNLDFNGADAFTFVANDGAADSNTATIALQVLAVNDAPIAIAQTVSTDEDTSLNIVLSASDVDTPATNLSYRIVAPPTHGALSGTAPNLVYTPNANFNGADSFTFVANDGIVDSNVAQIALQVLAVNDAPVAIAQQLSTDNAVALSITLSATDVDGDALSFAVISGPRHGTLSGTAPNLIYTANAGFRGSDTFTFAASDGTATSQATIQITVGGDAAVSAVDDKYDLILGALGQAQQPGVVLLSSGIFRMDVPGVLRNDSFSPGSSLTVRAISNPQNGRFQLRNDGSLFYLPSSGKIGPDEFMYALSDGKTTATARVRLNVIDKRAPELAFDTPRDRETVSQFTVIKGRVRDRNAGVKNVTLLWQRFDGKFWNGVAWVASPTELPLVVQGIDWVYHGNLPAPGANLPAGRYDLRVTATDKSGNISRVTNRVTVKQNEPSAAESSVRLSSASASVAQNAIVLHFTGAINAASASEMMNYSLIINGAKAQVNKADYAENSVRLSGFVLAEGDAIQLSIEGLRDATGKTLKSGTINLVAR